MNVIDVHVHTPDIFSIYKHGCDEVKKWLLKEMDKANIEVIFLYALEVNPRIVLEKVKINDIYKGLEEIINYGDLRLPPSLLRTVDDFNRTLLEHSNMLKTIFTPSERIIKICRGTKRIVPVGSIDITSNVEEVIERVSKILELGAVGIKIIPTLQMVDKKKLRVLNRIAEILKDEGKMLFVHTSCDPGIWELPRYCKVANPKNFEKIIKKHKDLTVVLCHMGAYSALYPGIYLQEALEMAKKYDNVYLDTAAVEPHLIKIACEKVEYSRIFFGSDYPVTGHSWKDLVLNVKLLDLNDNVKEHILRYNIIDLMKTLNLW